MGTVLPHAAAEETGAQGGEATCQVSQLGFSPSGHPAATAGQFSLPGGLRLQVPECGLTGSGQPLKTPAPIGRPSSTVSRGEIQDPPPSTSSDSACHAWYWTLWGVLSQSCQCPGVPPGSSTQEFILAVLVWPCGTPGIEPRPVSCKTTSLLAAQ